MQKKIKAAISEIEFHNYGGACETINHVIATASKYSDAHPYGPVHHTKKKTQVTPQVNQDLAEAKKFLKIAVSEIDFNNLNGTIDFLNRANQICNKY